MGKQHNTFPGERPEMPAQQPRPEISQPADPNVPNIPREDPDRTPQELPPVESPQEDPPLKTV